MNRAFFASYLLFILISVSCSTTTAIKTSSPELPPLESALEKIRRNSPEIEKHYLIDETGALIVRGNTDNFQVEYDLKNARIESAGTYLIPFTVTYLDTGAVEEDTLLWTPQQDGAGILLSFDDNFFYTWERYFDLLDRYNAHATFFVLGTYSAFADKAAKRGHDVGYHSLNHVNLSKVSRQTFYAETISPLASFAYPFGFYEPWMHEELLKTYKILRGFNTYFQAYSKANIIQDGFILSKSIDNILYKQDDDFKAAIDVMLMTVKFIGRDLILPITTHNISDTDDWGIKPQRLEYLLQIAADLQLRFYRYRDLL